ncbi:MAG: hypothetical protein H7230_03715 [Candidatus Parcubacteria bacterium]|nr:hypothetical protein [Candidatus Paceibacterota bacterium]
MPTKSILLRRTLATILFFNSTIGVLLLLPKSPLSEKFFGLSPDTPVYAMAIFLVLNLILLLSGFLFSQNMQFLMTFRGLDERAQSIKKDIILKSFPGVLIILVGWLFLQYLMISEMKYQDGSPMITLDDYWNKLAGYFAFVPVLVFPYIVCLWTDKDTQIKNPYISLKLFCLNSLQVALVFCLISTMFGTVAMSKLLQYNSNYREFNKSNIYLRGDTNFEIAINPDLEVDSFEVVSNNFSIAQMDIYAFGESKDSGNGFKTQTSIANLSANIFDQNMAYLSVPKGSLYFVSGYRWGWTHNIFGTPTIKIQVKELKELRILNTKSVKITTANNQCLDKETFKLSREGLYAGNLELPCDLKIKDIKNMQDLTEAFR